MQCNWVCSHPAIQKWETDLNCSLPEAVWAETWISFCAAKENAFLWQLIFRAFATLSWRFPARPHTDLLVWCLRCNQGLREDHLHCIWLCSSSHRCWQWCDQGSTPAGRGVHLAKIYSRAQACHRGRSSARCLGSPT